MRAAFASLLVLTSCTGGLVMPPAEFDHLYQGQLIEHVLSYRGGKVVSAAFLGGQRCDIFLPNAEDHGIGKARREALRRIEIANCNGWAARDGDMNAHDRL